MKKMLFLFGILLSANVLASDYLCSYQARISSDDITAAATILRHNIVGMLLPPSFVRNVRISINLVCVMMKTKEIVYLHRKKIGHGWSVGWLQAKSVQIRFGAL